MNGEDQGPNLSDFNPSWMEDGLGFTGEQGEQDFSNAQQWDTNAWTQGADDTQDQISSGAGGFTVQVAATGDFAGGETMVTGVDTITFNSDLFKIHDNGGGEVQVTLVTTTCP